VISSQLVRLDAINGFSDIHGCSEDGETMKNETDVNCQRKILIINNWLPNSETTFMN
jgi:hypothetical protein